MRTTVIRLLFLTLTLPLTLAVQPVLAGPVSGRVVDPDGRPVAGAVVLLVHTGTVARRTTTDDAGRFGLQAPDHGRYELRVAREGFRTQPVVLRGGADPIDAGTIALAVSAVSEAVVVSATQVEIPLSAASSSVTLITGTELLARQTETLADALRMVPGISVAAQGGRGALASVFPRGGDSDYSLVFVDGVQANTFGGGFDFAHLPVVNIDRIEIVRGPQSALYGSNAIGAVIRVITKRGGPPSGLASFEGGSFGTTRVTAAASGSAAAWHWGGSAERLASDGLTGRQSAAGERIENDGYSRYALSGGGGWSRPDGAAVRGDVRYIADERGAPGPFGSNPAGFFGGIDSVSRGDNDRWLMSISGAAPAGQRVRTHAQVAHGRLDGVFRYPVGDQVQSSLSWSRRTSARVQADATLAHGVDGSAGAELQRERAGSTFITAGGVEVPVERGLTGLFAEARWNRDARVFLTAGLRVERITRDALAPDANAFAPRPGFPADTIVSVNPKISGAWFLRSADGGFTKLRASAGTGIRSPDGFEIAFTDNPSLKPERSRSAEAGVDHAFLAGRALVEATVFGNTYDDLIVAVGSFSASSRYRTDNISNARSRGLELAGTARARRTGSRTVDLQARAAYTLLDTTILAVDGGAGAPPPFTPGDALLRRPRHQIAADLLVQAGRVTGYLQGGGRSRVRDVEPSFGTFGGVFDAAGHAVLNAGGSWKIAPPVELFGRITNLLDRSYEEVLGYPALGRGAFAGIRVAAGR